MAAIFLACSAVKLLIVFPYEPFSFAAPLLKVALAPVTGLLESNSSNIFRKYVLDSVVVCLWSNSISAVSCCLNESIPFVVSTFGAYGSTYPSKPACDGLDDIPPNSEAFLEAIDPFLPACCSEGAVLKLDRPAPSPPLSAP